MRLAAKVTSQRTIGLPVAVVGDRQPGRKVLAAQLQAGLEVLHELRIAGGIGLERKSRPSSTFSGDIFPSGSAFIQASCM